MSVARVRRTAAAGLALAGLVFQASCASPRIAVDERYAEATGTGGPVIVVREFELDTDVVRYEGPPEWLGIDVAQRIVVHLRRHGHDARVAALDAPEAGDRIVRGRIVRVDGGSKTARTWAGVYGAGGGFFGVEGELLDADGDVLGVFADERRSSIKQSSFALIERCVEAVASDVAEEVANAPGD